MQTQRRAVIDIGTNSVKLLVADVEGRRVEPVLEQSEQTRLGRGFYAHSRLQPEAIAATARAVAHFAGTAKNSQAITTRVIATSAARDALNQHELIEAIHAASGLSVEIIHGDHEADLVFQGVSSDPELAQRRLLIVDVGGGSTEFILGESGHKIFAASFLLGSVRLLEKFPPGDPPTGQDFARCYDWIKDLVAQEIRPRLDAQIQRESPDPVRLIGTGGATSILVRIEHAMTGFDRERIDATRLSLDRVRELTRQLWSLPLAERKKMVGLPPNRADVILMGAAIFQVIMEAFNFSELRVSTRGLRFAAVLGES